MPLDRANSAPLASPDDFPAARRCAYVNSASVALMYRGADEAVCAWQKDVAENGTLNFDEVAEDRVFDEVRSAFARLIGADDADIAVASSATELIASLAWAVAPRRGRNIVAVDVVFPSTVYPWVRVARETGCELRWVKARDAVVDEDELIAAIDDDTAIVCICHVEYASGQRYDLARIGEAARAHGALLIVDATQSLGAVPFDLASEPVDALVCGSYKWLCGPFGVGLMYVKPELAARLDPGIVGWRSNTAIYDLRADRIEYASTARRFEFSTMAYGCAVGLGRSIDYLRGVGVERIFAHNRRRAAEFSEIVQGLGAKLVFPTFERDGTSIVGARFDWGSPKQVIAALTPRGVVASARRDFVRFSFHLYNGGEDVEAVASALRESARQGVD